MRTAILDALEARYEAQVAEAHEVIKIYLENPVGIGEHSNIVEAMEEELNTIAKYQDQIDVINKYFKHK